jgi:hypothetical protein
LISVEDVRPYIGYYVGDIIAAAQSEDEALWSVSVLTYVIFYHFDGVIALLKAFGQDINPDGELFKGFVGRVAQGANARARDLQEAARQEWKQIQQRAVPA